MKGQLLARILMWVVIVALVWYFAQQWNRMTPSEEEHEAMMDAARSYQENKAQQRQSEGISESDVPQPEAKP